MLLHTLDDGEHPVTFALHRLLKAKKNYKALAIVSGVKKCHKYFFSRCFGLITDYKPLLSILSAKAEVPSVTATCMQCWAIFLSAHRTVRLNQGH